MLIFKRTCWFPEDYGTKILKGKFDQYILNEHGVLMCIVLYKGVPRMVLTMSFEKITSNRE